jgi:hypothetical protein
MAAHWNPSLPLDQALADAGVLRQPVRGLCASIAPDRTYPIWNLVFGRNRKPG